MEFRPHWGGRVANLNLGDLPVVRVFPNPTSNIVTVHFNPSVYREVQLSDLQGRCIEIKNISKKNDRSNLI